MKKIILIFLSGLFLISCGQYQKTLNSKDPMRQYKMGTKLYEKGKYARAERLFEMAEEALKTTPHYERLKYMKAKSLYEMHQYHSAGFEFRNFTRLFPKSSKREEAAFYIVKCYYELTPEYYRDLTYGIKMLEEAEQFLKRYPQSKYAEQVKKMSADIVYRLDKKDFENAKLYYNIGYYKAAIKAFNNFLSDHPGSGLKEQAQYYRFLAAAELALNSVPSKIKKRTEDALDFLKKFKAIYPQSKFLKEMERYGKRLQSVLQSETIKPKEKNKKV